MYRDITGIGWSQSPIWTPGRASPTGDIEITRYLTQKTGSIYIPNFPLCSKAFLKLLNTLGNSQSSGSLQIWGISILYKFKLLPSTLRLIRVKVGDQELATSGRELCQSRQVVERGAGGCAGLTVVDTVSGQSLHLNFFLWIITGFISVVRVEVSDIYFVYSINWRVDVYVHRHSLIWK